MLFFKKKKSKNKEIKNWWWSERADAGDLIIFSYACHRCIVLLGIVFKFSLFPLNKAFNYSAVLLDKCYSYPTEEYLGLFFLCYLQSTLNFCLGQLLLGKG